MATIFKGDKNKILEAFKLLFDAPGSPVIYYGDEIGMQNLKLTDKPIDSRLYVRGDFDWEEAQKQVQNPTSLYNKLASIVKDSGRI